MFRLSHTLRAVAAVGAGALALAACTADDPFDFDGQLDLGVIIPQTGELAFLGPAQVAAIEIAQADINEAGGVWGSDVTVVFHDEGDPAGTGTAAASADALIAAGVGAVVGPISTGATLEIIEPLRDAGVILVSPASPGIVLDDHPARDYYFRTAPSDVVQGPVLAREIVADLHQTVAIIARDDAYGAGLTALIETEIAENPPSPPLNEDGEPEGEPEPAEVLTVTYDPEATDFAADDFAAELAELGEAEPDAIVIISFAEGAEIMTRLADAGLAPADEVQWYLVNGNLDDYSEVLPEGTLAGVKATAPTGGGDPTALHSRMDEHTEDLTDYAYAVEAYDAVIALALGAIVANTDNPAEIRAAMLSISRAPGIPCETFADCRDLIEEGEDINYNGLSGPLDWTDSGDPGQGAIGIYSYSDENTYALQRVEVGRL